MSWNFTWYFFSLTLPFPGETLHRETFSGEKKQEWHKPVRENYLKRHTRRREDIELTVTYAVSESSVTADICLAVDDQMFPFLNDILIG